MPVVRADFHMHTHFSRDSMTSPQRLVARCLRVGLGCIAVTDHNTIRGAQAVARIAPFPVIIAAEVKSTKGEITGFFLKEEVPPGLSPLETVQRIKAQGGLVSIPHPFDSLRRSVIAREALEEVLPHADIIEVFNARNTFGAANQQALEVARRHGLLITAVSDAHHPLELGRAYTEMPEFDGTPEGFKKALTQARLVGRPANPLVHFLSAYAKLVRRLRAPPQVRAD
jgi:hypothetical protein